MSSGADPPDSLFGFLPEPPALILSYLSTSLASGLISGRTLLIGLLFQQESTSLSLASVATVCGILNTNLSDLDTTNRLPSSLESPAVQSDIGPSSPPPSQQRWTLALLLPLLRYCADPHSRTQVQPIIQLVSRVLACVAPYPAPPFDVGLEASQLMASLPDVVSGPLRESLSGLMMDLAVSDGVARTQATHEQQQRSHPVQQHAGPDAIADITFASPGEMFVPVLSQAMALLVSNYRRNRNRSDLPDQSEIPDGPNRGLVNLLRLSWRMCDQADTVLSTLVNAIVSQGVAEPPGLVASSLEAWMVLVADLPLVLTWWKKQSEARLPYPVSWLSLSVIICSSFTHLLGEPRCCPAECIRDQ